MIAFEFEYYKPAQAAEAVQLFQSLQAAGKEPLYYAGGTDIICRARSGAVRTGAVIDIKGIPECQVLGWDGDQLHLGSAATLSQVADANLFPLLSRVIRPVADRTARNKITLGGNLLGSDCFREAVLPFLLAESRLLIAGVNGNREVPIRELHQEKLQLANGELLLQIITDREPTVSPFAARRRTRLPAVDYPLVTVALMVVGTQLRAAFSGICGYPFRSDKVERILNNSCSGFQAAVRHLPTPILDDFRGSADYREALLGLLITEAIQGLEGGRAQ